MTLLRALIALAVCLTVPAFAAGQGLGAAAAKEKQRRGPGQKTGKPAKTYTEEDLKGLRPVENPGVSNSSGASSGTGTSTSTSEASKSDLPFPSQNAEPSGASEEDARAQAEARWRARADGARARIEEARRKVEYFEGLNLVPGVEYVDEQGRPVIRSVQQLQGMTRSAKAELAAAEKALEDLQDEARRAGVPPGWLR